MLSWLSRSFFVLSIVLAVWLVWVLIQTEKYPPKLTVHWPEKDLGELTIGLHDMNISVSNLGEEDGEILGIMEECRAKVCVSANDFDRVIVKPGTTVNLSCRIEVKGTGDFSFPLVLYLDENGFHEVSQDMRGKGKTIRAIQK